MKNPTTMLSLLIWGGLLLPSAADSILLKNGEKLEGRLLEETEDAYVLEVMIGTSIKDERVIPKADVVSMEKERPDFAAFDEIKGLVPTPDGLSIDDYRQRIEMVSKFNTTYPSSPKVDQALGILAKLRAEMREIASGGLKHNGVLYNAESRQANAYEIDSNVEASAIRKLVAQGQLLQALRSFAAFENEYAPTLAYHNLLPVVIDALSVYQRQLSHLRRTYAERVQERIDGLKNMGINSRMASEAAIREQDDLLLKHYEAETAANVQWVTPHPFSKQAIEHGIKQADSVLKNLKSRQVVEPVDGGKIYREALSLARRGDNPQAAAPLVEQAVKLGIPERYTEVLRNALGQDTTGAGQTP